MNLIQLNFFITVAEAGSFRKAADILYNSQPNITRAIHKLEEELGVTLFERTPRGVTLTADGQNAYYYANAILKQVDTLGRIHPDETPIATTLNIAVAGLFSPDDLLSDLIGEMDIPKIALNIFETNIEDLLTRMGEGQAEMGLMTLHPPIEGVVRRSLARCHLSADIIARSPTCLHFSNADPLCAKTEFSLKDLSGYRYLMGTPDYYTNLTRQHLRQAHPLFPFERVLSTNRTHTIIRALKRPGFFTIGNRFQEKELKKAGVHTRVLPETGDSQTLLWVYPKGRPLFPGDPAWVMKNLIDRYYGDK